MNLATLFKNLRLVEITEMNLSSNQPKSAVKRYKWKTASSPGIEKEPHLSADLPIVDLRPMEIRTFLIRLQRQ